MKKIISITLAILLTLTFCACNTNQSNENVTSKNEEVENVSWTDYDVSAEDEIYSSTKDSSTNNSSNEEIVEASEIKSDFPTIDEYISVLETNINKSAIGEGTITNGKYEFLLSNAIKVTLVLNANNEVVNASFMTKGSLTNSTEDVIYTMGIGVVLMQPFCELCESEDFDTETVIKSIYQKINEEIEKNNHTYNFFADYKFGNCSFSMNSVALDSTILFMVATGYKK